MSVRFRILLALSTCRYSDALVDHALDLASEVDDPLLDVLYVYDEPSLESTREQAEAEGYLGPDPQQQVIDAIESSRERSKERRLQGVRERARELGIEMVSSVREGRFAASVIAHAEEHPPDQILVGRADRPWLAVVLLGSEVAKIERAAEDEGLGEVIVED